MRYDQRLGYYALIKINRIHKTYYYDDPNYSIDNIPLSEEELDSIVFASRLLEQFKNVDILKTFTGSVQKLVDAVNIYRHNREDIYQNFIEFEKVDEAKRTEYIEPILHALKNKELLRITFRNIGPVNLNAQTMILIRRLEHLT